MDLQHLRAPGACGNGAPHFVHAFAGNGVYIMPIMMSRQGRPWYRHCSVKDAGGDISYSMHIVTSSSLRKIKSREKHNTKTQVRLLVDEILYDDDVNQEGDGPHDAAPSATVSTA